MERSIAEMEAERKAKEAAVLRHFSLTRMVRASGIRRSPSARCACGRRISSSKKSCLKCVGVIRVDAEVKAVPCAARGGN